MNAATSKTQPVEPSSEDVPPAEQPTEPRTLPDEPLVVIEPTNSWVALNLRDVWAHRELLYFLTWRDVKVRYKQTLLGATWAVVQPLLTMVIFTFIFNRVAQISSEGIPYPIFAYAGLLPWTFFSNAVSSSGNSLVGSSHLITKVYFPRMIIPGAAVTAGLVDFGIAFLMLVILMAYYHIGVSWQIVVLPVLIVHTTLLAFAVGMWLSALNVKYRDVRFALPFLVQIWMYISPIAYPASVVPQRWRLVYSLNPITGIVGGYRSALFGQALDWAALSLSVVTTMLLLVYSLYFFRKTEKSFADIV